MLRSEIQVRHKTGVTGPGELLNPVQHSPQLHSDREPLLDRLEIANLHFPTRPRNPGASRGTRISDICAANRACWAHNLLRSTTNYATRPV